MTATATQLPTIATPAQLSYIQSLMAQRQVSDQYRSDLEYLVGAGWHLVSRKVASSVIDFLKDQPYAPKAPKAEATPAAPAASLEGMHRLGQDIYKVQLAVHGSGRPYAKVLTQDLESGWHFETAHGAIRKLSEATRLTLAEAEEFGALYGVCCVCGATLTDESSIAAGIGPICRKRF